MTQIIWNEFIFLLLPMTIEDRRSLFPRKVINWESKSFVFDLIVTNFGPNVEEKVNLFVTYDNRCLSLLHRRVINWESRVLFLTL